MQRKSKIFVDLKTSFSNKKIIILLVCLTVLLSFNASADVCGFNDCPPCSTGGVCSGEQPDCQCDYGSGGPPGGGSCCGPGEWEVICNQAFPEPGCWDCSDIFVKCLDCGFLDEPCCNDPVIEIDCFSANLYCDAGTCVACGVEGFECCLGTNCESGMYCDTDNGDYCCKTWFFWNGAACQGADHCNDCPYNPPPNADAEYWFDSRCIYGGATECCCVTGNFGDPNFKEWIGITVY